MNDGVTPIDRKLRERLARLADALIPPVDDMPAPSSLGIAGAQLDTVLASRPDLAADLEHALGTADEAEDPIAWLAALRRDDPAGHDALVAAVVAGYYMHSQVMRLLGYPGQVAQPVSIGALPDYVEEGLLERVYERGPIYRPTPVTPA